MQYCNESFEFVASVQIMHFSCILTDRDVVSRHPYLLRLRKQISRVESDSNSPKLAFVEIQMQISEIFAFKLWLRDCHTEIQPTYKAED